MMFWSPLLVCVSVKIYRSIRRDYLFGGGVYLGSPGEEVLDDVDVALLRGQVQRVQSILHKNKNRL